MTEAQRNEIQAQLMAIGQINAALQAGTDSGLFDEMAACISHPDLINTFCDDMAKMTACSMIPFKVTAPTTKPMTGYFLSPHRMLKW